MPLKMRTSADYRNRRCTSDRPIGPGPDPADAFGRRADDVAGRRVIHVREPDVRAQVDLSEPLQELRSTALLDPGVPADDEVLAKSELVVPGALHRDDDARVALDVLHLLVSRQVTAHDLVAVEPHPDAGHLRPSV